MPVSHIPVGNALRLLRQAQAEGCDIEAVMASLSLSMEELEHKASLTAFQYGQLYQRLMRELNDECFGMVAEAKVPLGSFRMMCLSLLQCKDFRQALILAGEFSEICRGMGVRYLLEEQGNEAHLVLGPVRSKTQEQYAQMMSHCQPDDIVTTLLASYRFHSWLIGRAIPVLQLNVSFEADDCVLDLAEFDAQIVRTGQEFNSIVYPLDTFDAPVVQNLNTTLDFLRTAPYHLITLDPNRLSTAEKVRNILNRDVGFNMPSAESVAQQLHVSSPTLRRKLLQEQSSFQAIKDEVRLEAALNYLACLDLPVVEIADRLGFDEPSTFFRAFKKWTGSTPGQYRQKLNQA